MEGDKAMRLKLFTKDNKICYSTGKSKYIGDIYQLSPKEYELKKRGWVYAGQITGRDMSALSSITTMTKELKSGKAQ